MQVIRKNSAQQTYGRLYGSHEARPVANMTLWTWCPEGSVILHGYTSTKAVLSRGKKTWNDTTSSAGGTCATISRFGTMRFIMNDLRGPGGTRHSLDETKMGGTQVHSE